MTARCTMPSIPRLFCFDMDGTLTDTASSWEHLSRHLGIWDGLAEHHLHAFIRGEIDYMEFCRMDALVLKGLDSGLINAAMDTIRIDAGIAKLASYLRANGCRTALVSSGLNVMAERVTSIADFEYVFVNELEVSQGIMTGGVKVNVSIDDETMTKRAIVRALAEGHGLKGAEVAAVGDNWGDHGMIEEAGMRFFVDRVSAETEKARSSFPDITVVRNMEDLLLHISDGSLS